MQGEADELIDARTVLVVADGAAVQAALAQMVRVLPGLRPIVVGWAQAVAAFDNISRVAAVIADCRDVTGAVIEPSLVALLTAAQLAPAPLVVGFAADQLDRIAAVLLGEAILLSDPDPLDWTTALVVAAPTSELLTVRDGSFESDRFERLSREVARIAEALAGLIEPETTRDQQHKDDGYVGEPPRGYGARPGEIDPGEIRRAIRARRLRDEAFAHGGLFEDPAWDMLLDLFAAELERRPVSVSSLCIAAAVPATTALRWISKLIGMGLFERKPDSHDRRRAFITLSMAASQAMRSYVDSLRKAGLRLG